MVGQLNDGDEGQNLPTAIVLNEIGLVEVGVLAVVVLIVVDGVNVDEL